MIPKIINYCWFGNNPKPKLAQKCIKSWKKYCKGYDIVEWNEDSFDIASAPLYVRQAYEAKKWAFVTDYVRLKVVYDNGGIYLDTDVQVIKPLDDLLNFNAFFGFEEIKYVATGLGFGAIKHASILKQIMEQYYDIPFILNDGSFDTKSCPMRNTEIFVKNGLEQNGETQIIADNIAVFSTEYFCPISYSDNKKRITPNTYSIHWFSASWQTEQNRKEYNQRIKKQRRIEFTDRIIHIPNLFLIKILGKSRYEKIKNKIKK